MSTTTALREELAALGAHLAPARRAEVAELAAALPEVAEPGPLADTLARVADLAATEAAERMAHPAVSTPPGQGGPAKWAALAASGAAALAGRLAADYAAGGQA